MTHILQQTLDGSHTIYIPEMDEHYHSTNGAMQEALHIYIAKAYQHSAVQNPTVFEVGFGTGLNALLTALEAERTQRKTTFVSIEKYPLSQESYNSLNYPDLLGEEAKPLFTAMHSCKWNELCEISEYFTLKKLHADLTELPDIPNFDVVYFDAFAPNKQASMWTEEILAYVCAHTNPGGILTTYCAKGDVRRMLQSVGFSVERTDGPIGKREMLRATNITHELAL